MKLTAIDPVQFTIGGSANDVTFTSSPAGLGFTRNDNVSIAGGNTVILSGQAPDVATETTFTYTLEQLTLLLVLFSKLLEEQLQCSHHQFMMLIS